MKRLARIIGTFFGVGYLPIAPGTWGSLAGLLIYILFLKANPALHSLILLVIIILGFYASSFAQALFGKEDPSLIVIDEVAGILLTFLFVPFTGLNLIFGFFLFRLFDTIKAPPIDWAEGLSGPYGIMTDDLIAAIYSNICLQAVNLLGVRLGLF